MIFLAASYPDYASAALIVSRIGQDLAVKQKTLGLTTKTLAKQLGVTTTTTTRLLAGGVPTQPTILAALRWLADH